MGFMDYFYNSVDMEDVPEDDGRSNRGRGFAKSRSSEEQSRAYDRNDESVDRYNRYGDDDRYVAATRQGSRDGESPRVKARSSEPTGMAGQPYSGAAAAPPLNYARRMTSLSEVLVYSPQGYEDVQGLIDYLKNGTPIIVDLNAVRDSAAQRILDFLSGAIYAIDGSVMKLKGSMFLLTPGGVTIST